MTGGGAGREAGIGRLLGSAAAARFGGAAELMVVNWWVLAVTGEPAMIAVVTAARLVPLLLAGPAAGAIADRVPATRLLRLMGVASAAAAAAACAVMSAAPIPGAGAGTATGGFDGAPGWAMAAIMLVKAAFTAPEPAVRQLAVSRAVGEAGLVRGMSDLSTIGSLCLIAGPVAAGAVLALAGPAAAMAPVVAAYAASALVLPAPTAGGAPGAGPARGGIGAGGLLRVLSSESRLSAQMLLAIGPMVSIFPYTAMIPVVFPDQPSWPPGAGAATGAACAAAGAVGATVWLRSREIADPARWALVSAALVSVPVGMAAAWIFGGGHPAVTFAAFVAIGWIGQVYRTMNRTAVVMLSPPAARGAVLGVSSGDRVLIPLGAFVFGLIAGEAGGAGMLAAMAAANSLAVGATWALLLRKRRR